jgi:propanediol dehydratase large subunit
MLPYWNTYSDGASVVNGRENPVQLANQAAPDLKSGIDQGAGGIRR